ncbi:MAG: hypothetical protein DRH32_09200 [Deltaproteobacteria bacterium]|nr:MAG: hypothetical protein DRH32_09200 [Deltaproteobacteria bacterium]
MKIAVATDDGASIKKNHFGSSRYYQIIEILNGEIISRELRRNPHTETKDKDHHPHGESGPILELLADCSLFIGRSMGKKSVAAISAKRIDCIITKFEMIDDAVNNYLNGADQGFKFYDAEAGKFISCQERELKIRSV